jgi:hypothetical protein
MSEQKNMKNITFKLTRETKSWKKRSTSTTRGASRLGFSVGANC